MLKVKNFISMVLIVREYYHVLKTHNINSPEQLSVFGSLQVFELSDCESVTDVSALAHILILLYANVRISLILIDEVKICGIFKIFQVTIAGKVKKVQLAGLSSLSQLSLLGYVQELNIEMAESLIRLDNVPFAQSISLEGSFSLEEISPSLEVKKLIMDECVSIKSIQSLQFLETLTISTTDELRSFEDLPSLTTLQFDNCDGIERMANLPLCKNYKVYLGIEDIEDLEVVNCPGYIKPSVTDEQRAILRIMRMNDDLFDEDEESNSAEEDNSADEENSIEEDDLSLYW
eukprot:gene10487-11411_t